MKKKVLLKQKNYYYVNFIYDILSVSLVLLLPPSARCAGNVFKPNIFLLFG